MYLVERDYLVRRNEELFIRISEEQFNRLSAAEKEELLYSLREFIISQYFYLNQFPAFLLSEREILLAVCYNIWEKDQEEIDNIKHVLLKSEHIKNLDFILELIHCDDGSLALIVADDTITLRSDFWIAVLTRWYNSPMESKPEPADYRTIYDPVPENLKNEPEFNHKLLSMIPGFYHALSDTLKNNLDIVAIALNADGMMLAQMPETIRENPDLAYIAICQNNKAVEFISDNLTYDVQFIKKTIDANPDVLAYCIPRMRYLYNNPTAT